MVPCAGDDIVDEAIAFFRANVLFKSFEPKGGADLLRHVLDGEDP